jgi:hypothetical protein
MSTFLFLAYDADRAGRLIGNARLQDDPEELRQISNTIDSGNQIWKDWAINNGGSMISCGGDEGIIACPAAALNDLTGIKDQYQNLLNLTVSIGIGMKMSEAFKALMTAKLRGRNRTVFYDKEVDEEIQKVMQDGDSDSKKIVDEYLTKSEVLEKRQPIHHTGKGGKQTVALTASQNPEIQQKETLKDMPEPSKSKIAHFENSFRSMANASQTKYNALKTQKSANYQNLKQKMAIALQGIQKQLPQLAEIKQAAPETYAAVLALVKGVIAIGQELKTTDEKLSKAIGQVDIWHNQSLPPTGMLSTSTGGLETYDLGMDKSDLLPGGLADKNTPNQFDQEQLAIGTQIELEHTNDEAIAREIAMDHLKEDPNYYKVEQSLKKMALLYDNLQHPITIYRVQNEKGEGPYTTDTYLKGAPDSKQQPSPMDDFAEEILAMPPQKSIKLRHYRFGFENQQKAKEWFGNDLEKLKPLGFNLVPVKASKVYKGRSGKQIIFIPHESESLLNNINKSDWPMSESKEELDPSRQLPNEKVLDKSVIPEHIKSIKAKGNLVPGQALDGRHVVVRNASGNNVIRQVAAGMQRDLNDHESTPVGPGFGNPTSTRNKPSHT